MLDGDEASDHEMEMDAVSAAPSATSSSQQCVNFLLPPLNADSSERLPTSRVGIGEDKFGSLTLTPRHDFRLPPLTALPGEQTSGASSSSYRQGSHHGVPLNSHFHIGGQNQSTESRDPLTLGAGATSSNFQHGTDGAQVSTSRGMHTSVSSGMTHAPVHQQTRQASLATSPLQNEQQTSRNEAIQNDIAIFRSIVKTLSPDERSIYILSCPPQVVQAAAVESVRNAIKNTQQSTARKMPGIAEGVGTSPMMGVGRGVGQARGFRTTQTTDLGRGVGSTNFAHRVGTSQSTRFRHGDISQMSVTNPESASLIHTGQHQAVGIGIVPHANASRSVGRPTSTDASKGTHQTGVANPESSSLVPTAQHQASGVGMAPHANVTHVFGGTTPTDTGNGIHQTDVANLMSSSLVGASQNFGTATPANTSQGVGATLQPDVSRTTPRARQAGITRDIGETWPPGIGAAQPVRNRQVSRTLDSSGDRIQPQTHAQLPFTLENFALSEDPGVTSGTSMRASQHMVSRDTYSPADTNTGFVSPLPPSKSASSGIPGSSGGAGIYQHARQQEPLSSLHDPSGFLTLGNPLDLQLDGSASRVASGATTNARASQQSLSRNDTTNPTVAAQQNPPHGVSFDINSAKSRKPAQTASQPMFSSSSVPALGNNTTVSSTSSTAEKDMMRRNHEASFLDLNDPIDSLLLDADSQLPPATATGASTLQSLFPPNDLTLDLTSGTDVSLINSNPAGSTSSHSVGSQFSHPVGSQFSHSVGSQFSNPAGSQFSHQFRSTTTFSQRPRQG